MLILCTRNSIKEYGGHKTAQTGQWIILSKKINDEISIRGSIFVLLDKQLLKLFLLEINKYMSAWWAIMLSFSSFW